MKYKNKHPIRIVTATSLFDGHDVAINVIRRILQDFGAEVIHLGHNRSVEEVVFTALQEGVQSITVSSYQGGHIEYFKYMKDLLVQEGAPYVKIFGGGGGVIIKKEKALLEAYGITRIFHSDDGRALGLEGMIEVIMKASDFDLLEASAKNQNIKRKINEKGEKESREKKKPSKEEEHRKKTQDLKALSSPLALALNFFENFDETDKEKKKIFLNLKKELSFFQNQDKNPPLVLGITGTGGAGKSSLLDELLQRFLNHYPDIKIAVICIDPSKRKTGGALLGDRLRMNAIDPSHIYMRSQASRGSGKEISKSLPRVLHFLKELNFDLLIVESSGIGQSSSAVTEVCDQSLYVMTSDFGAESQLEKIDMIDFADFIVINKADQKGAMDAEKAVKKQYQRSRKLFQVKDKSVFPIYLTQALCFNDPGVNKLFYALVENWSKTSFKGPWKNELREKNQTKQSEDQSKIQNGTKAQRQTHHIQTQTQKRFQTLIPSERTHSLSQIVACIRNYKNRTDDLAKKASKLMILKEWKMLDKKNSLPFDQKIKELRDSFQEEEWKVLNSFHDLEKKYKGKEENISKEKKENKGKFEDSIGEEKTLSYTVRGQKISRSLTWKSLSGLRLPRVIFPKIRDWGERFRFLRLENAPGMFPFTAGVFPLKREFEDPIRQFAGEGPPERTNKRFHFLSQESDVKRLSVAFDSVTLYGEDPALRPDIFGKIGESGVSISSLNDMKRLFKGFDLCDPKTSVSMTINGPASVILAFFFNTAIDQEREKKKKELGGRTLSFEEEEALKLHTLRTIRGTVQADILKEDQSQNTCIFSIHFALRLMADVQKYFVEKNIKNFYSVSVSGYHIAEAGANPISQLSFTLSNAFTFVEYYKACGLQVDDFVPNFSFFFSNGLDPEYTVIGRVARRIWAIAMKEFYGASEASQKLKYHIQTSGRSLHAQEMTFNDIRTTLQALLALQDNCNSLHTNAYDEAITTPTKHSVRKAQAIQMIINKEFGQIKNENFLQGSYFLEWLTNEVEETVLEEFLRIDERGGVIGAMETHYQRSKIQEESLYYETLKHSGELPLIGVNTFLDPGEKSASEASSATSTIELTRTSVEEKKLQWKRVENYKKKNEKKAQTELKKLKKVALSQENIFEALMSASQYCSLSQITEALYEVGGRYRRNL